MAEQPVEQQTQTLPFAQDSVINMTSIDFDLSSPEKIKISNKNCILILFYINNVESQELLQVWQSAAAQVAGPIFASVDLSKERAIATAFTQLRSDTSNPLQWAGLRGIPYILVYRGGWPVGFYNGGRNVQNIIDFSTILACSFEYTERNQNIEGVQATEIFGINRTIPLEREQTISKSTDFQGADTERGYTPGIIKYSLVITPEAQQQAAAQPTVAEPGAPVVLQPEAQ